MSKSHLTTFGAVGDQYLNEKSEQVLFENLKIECYENEMETQGITTSSQNIGTYMEVPHAQTNVTNKVIACSLPGDIQDATYNNPATKELRTFNVSDTFFNADRLKDLGEPPPLNLEAFNETDINLSHQSATDLEEPEWLDIENPLSGKRNIGIGPEHQALIPKKLKIYDDVPMYENEDVLLWDPSKLDEEEVQNYLKECLVIKSEKFCNRIPSGRHMRDNEQDLYLLLQSGYNQAEALRRKRINASSSTYSMTPWSQEECKYFEIGIIEYGKNFHKIQNSLIKTRTVKELIHFYYLWKKTERHDILAAENKIGKKKYAFIPGCTNYMDRYLDGEENRLNIQSSAKLKSCTRSANDRKTSNIANTKETSCISNLECNSQDIPDATVTINVKKELPE